MALDTATKDRLARFHPQLFPKLVFIGAAPRCAGLIDLYGLAHFERLAVCDRDPARVGHSLAGRPILDPAAISWADVELVAISEDPVAEFQEALALARSFGVPDDRIVRIDQPGRFHRSLARLANIDPGRRREIGYRAIRHNLFHRGQYAYCMVLAAETALRMGLKSVTAIEFGVWYGAGLLNMCEIADFIEQTLGVSFRVVGFDTGQGLPDVADYRDHPELWASGTLAMPNYDELRAALPANAELIIGDIANTLDGLVATLTRDAPVGFVAVDVDQYHSTLSSLRIFDAAPEKLLPVIPVWVDDSYLSVLQSVWAGEALAIRDFNERHALRKIEQKIIRTDDFPRLWHHCIWFAHIFDHDVRQGRQPARFDRFYHTDF